MQKRRTLNLNVSGPTGSGKSTLVGLMANHPDVSATREPQPAELLRRFDFDPTIYCFDLQRTILTCRLDERDGLAAGGRIQVRDRSPEEDFAIFATMFHAAGYLSSGQFAALREQATQVSIAIGGPDAFVLLRADDAVLEGRIAAAGAPNRVLSLLREQIRLYEQWFQSLTEPRIMIDTSSLEVNDLVPRSAWVLSSIERACAGERLRNSALGLAWTV